MEHIILLMLGFTLGAFTQYNFGLWQGMIKVLCFGLFRLKNLDTSKSIGELSIAGSVPMTFEKKSLFTYLDLSVLSIDRLLQDSDFDKRDIHIDKGKYNISINFKIEVKEASV